jgi:hypothetical protein
MGRTAAGECHDIALRVHIADELPDVRPLLEGNDLHVTRLRPGWLDVASAELELERLVVEASAVHAKQLAFIRSTGAGGAPTIDEQRAELPVGAKLRPRIGLPESGLTGNRFPIPQRHATAEHWLLLTERGDGERLGRART